MDSPRGRILSIERDGAPPRAVVEVARSLGCARCAAGKGCGAGLPGAGSQLRRVEALLAAGLELNEGDEVCIELAPHNVLRAAVAALVGLAAGLAVGRRRLSRAVCLKHFTPVITGRVASAGG